MLQRRSSNNAKKSRARCDANLSLESRADSCAFFWTIPRLQRFVQQLIPASHGTSAEPRKLVRSNSVNSVTECDRRFRMNASGPARRGQRGQKPPGGQRHRTFSLLLPPCPYQNGTAMIILVDHFDPAQPAKLTLKRPTGQNVCPPK
jgi:hypothetical protein